MPEPREDEPASDGERDAEEDAWELVAPDRDDDDRSEVDEPCEEVPGVWLVALDVPLLGACELVMSDAGFDVPEDAWKVADDDPPDDVNPASGSPSAPGTQPDGHRTDSHSALRAAGAAARDARLTWIMAPPP